MRLKSAGYRNISILVLFILIFNPSFSQIQKPWVEQMKFSPSYFGPNALPVPEFNEGRLPDYHYAALSVDNFWGYGDNTQSLSVRLNYAFIPGRLSLNAWGVIGEHYKVTQDVANQRKMATDKLDDFYATGDFYISTMIGLVKENKVIPDLNFEIILKTASSKTPSSARYFDTPGYCFNLFAGKSFFIKNGFVNEIRLAANYGFLCYQTNTLFQNDAWLYGTELILNSGCFRWSNGIGGYSGWLENGDCPVVLRSKLTYSLSHLDFFMQYQKSLRDYPFNRIQTGISLTIN